MNKIMETLQLNINEYVETQLCKYQNKETEQHLQNIRKDMFNYKMNFKKMLNKCLIDEAQFNYIKNSWFYCFDVIETFLKECNTKMYIGCYNITKILQQYYNNNIQNINFQILTNKNFKIIVGRNMFINHQYYYSCQFVSTDIKDNNLNYCFYIPNCNYKENQIFEFQDLDKHITLFEGVSMRMIQKDELENWKKEIKLVMKNTNIHQLDLDYLQIHNDNIVKSFFESNQSIQLAEKNEIIEQLQEIIEKKNEIIEEKCETIEQLNAELAKQKNNFANLNKERVKNNEHYNAKIEELNFAMNKQTINHNNLIDKHNLELQNLKQEYQNENYNCVKILKEKITRLQTELNDKNIANKKLTIQLNDLNELYENLQEKLV